MKLTALHFYKYSEPFKSQIVTPKVTLTHRDCLFIELIDDKGNAYFGECNAFQTDWYDHETIASVKHVIEQWFEDNRNKSFETYEAALKLVDSLENTPAARATIVMALYQMFHVLPSFSVAYGATASGLSNKQLESLKATKPTRIKLKWTPQIMHQIRVLRELDFHFQLVIDANESLDRQDFTQLQLLAREQVLYIEEPFKDISMLDEVVDGTIPPIALDEKATSLLDIINLIELYNVKVVVLKPFRLGGIDKVQTAIDALKSHGVKVVIGGMYEYGLSRYFTAMLARKGDYPGDVTPAGYYFDQDVVTKSGILKEGRLEFRPPLVDITQLQPY
ncbi:o-succinylbenzoate synthase [Staphylococcus aureus]|uniref:o-succinylbenzoate synthase n=1 Tax=Staphylococcus aureus TaxID=1280 RepID=UPI0016818332|nr:o-succinylbenzoate synthase [Staphylococcus aureus]MBD1741098.1 o-succinylbenzoate synthase [Staphylococcus aureus]MBU7874029.1 o-succinylbenzoate synthase [Staphylococcus aureus]MBU7876730.1 o-succinylbenzoate synthase [Staphylococcus aureus]MBU7879446.1 o-succinylbenzoate synthase [Staphylococcus aureus]MBU7882205.1 o-succinylbenzoate synthase [Staphylococcus aureus]